MQCAARNNSHHQPNGMESKSNTYNSINSRIMQCRMQPMLAMGTMHQPSTMYLKTAELASSQRVCVFVCASVSARSSRFCYINEKRIHVFCTNRFAVAFFFLSSLFSALPHLLQSIEQPTHANTTTRRRGSHTHAGIHNVHCRCVSV